MFPKCLPQGESTGWLLDYTVQFRKKVIEGIGAVLPFPLWEVVAEGAVEFGG